MTETDINLNKELVALDLGNKQTKIKTRQEVIIYPSKLIDTMSIGSIGWVNGSLSNLSTGLNQNQSNLHKYQILNHPDSYVWGENLTQLHLTNELQESIMYEGRYNTALYENLVNFALARAIKPLIKNTNQKLIIDVATGMPTGEYALENGEKIKELTRKVKGDHSVLIDGINYSFKVDNLIILPQPAGTLYDLLLRADGSIKEPELLQEKIRVIDIGGGTLILNEFDNFELNNNVESTTFDGSQKLFNLVRSNSDEQLFINKIEDAFTNLEKNNGEILYYKSKNDIKNITDISKKAVNYWTNQIINKINTVFAGLEEFDRTIFTGGSINLIDQELVNKQIKNVHFMKNGTIANVNGFYKLLKIREEQKQKEQNS